MRQVPRAAMSASRKRTQILINIAPLSSGESDKARLGLGCSGWQMPASHIEMLLLLLIGFSLVALKSRFRRWINL